MKAIGHPPAIIIDGVDPQTGERRIVVKSPEASSENRVDDCGALVASVVGVEAGRKAEPWAGKVLFARFKELGLEISKLSAEDDQGEDARFCVNGSTYVVQFISLPNESHFWRSAKHGSGSIKSDTGSAVELLEKAISAKVPRIPLQNRNSIILALDCRHLGLFVREEVMAHYIAQYGHPAVLHGFASVWVVGPMAKYCIRLGEGAP